MRPFAWILGRHGLLGRSLQTALAAAGIEEFLPAGRLKWDCPSELHSQLGACVSEFSAATGERPWQIYWAAGTGTMRSSANQLTGETAALATLLERLRRSALTDSEGTVLFASSAGAIYAGCGDEVITETTEERPETAYGRCKLAQEKMLTEFADEFPSCSAHRLRLTNLYGPHQSPSKPQGLISHVARSMLRHEPIHIFVPLDTIRDYLHVDDAAAAMVEAAKRGGGGDVRILASEQPTTIAQILGTFRAVTRAVPRIVTGASSLAAPYPRRMLFQSLRTVKKRITKPLLVGVAEVLAAERRRLLGQ